MILEEKNLCFSTHNKSDTPVKHKLHVYTTCRDQVTSVHKQIKFNSDAVELIVHEPNLSYSEIIEIMKNSIYLSVFMGSMALMQDINKRLADQELLYMCSLEEGLNVWQEKHNINYINDLKN